MVDVLDERLGADGEPDPDGEPYSKSLWRGWYAELEGDLSAGSGHAAPPAAAGAACRADAGEHAELASWRSFHGAAAAPEPANAGELSRLSSPAPGLHESAKRPRKPSVVTSFSRISLHFQYKLPDFLLKESGIHENNTTADGQCHGMAR